MNPRAGVAHQFEDGVQGNGLGNDGYAGQAHACGQCAFGGHTKAQKTVLRAQPSRVAKGASVLQCAVQHQGVVQRHFSLRKTHATRLGEFGHFGQRGAVQAAGERTQWEQTRLVQIARAVLQHLHQTGLVQRRVGVGQADQTGHATGHGGGHFRLQHAFVFMPRFAQAHRQIDQAGRNHQAARVDAAVGVEVGTDAAVLIAEADDATGGDGHVADAVASVGGIDDATIFDKYLHAEFPAMVDITAMRTAMPNVTCGRITLWLPSATAESISTPRLMGPGCMTMASGLASASLSGVRP